VTRKISEHFAGEHYCGDFPGAGGYLLRNEVMIYLVREDIRVGLDAPGWYWWNAKEGNGHNFGGPFETTREAYAAAFSYYPEMAKGKHHARYEALLKQEAPPSVYRGTRRLKRMVK
jgi:hypothetical protein